MLEIGSQHVTRQKTSCLMVLIDSATGDLIVKADTGAAARQIKAPGRAGAAGSCVEIASRVVISTA